MKQWMNCASNVAIYIECPIGGKTKGSLLSFRPAGIRSPMKHCLAEGRIFEANSR